MTGTALRGHPFAAEIRGLFGVAMAVFVLTVSVGILNGLDLIEFDRNTILTHVHSGAMGWISLSALAATLWLFGGPTTIVGAARVRQLTWLAAISIPFYVIAFWTGNLVFRAVTGVVVMVAIGWWLWWTWSAYRAAPPTVPRLAFLAGIVTLTYGSAVGVLLQIQYATESSFLPVDSVGAHVAAMAFSYLVLVGMGIVEWRLTGESAGISRGGAVQVIALFLGGLVLSVGALVGAIQVAGGLNLVGELIGVAIFVARMAGPVGRAPWFRASADRLFGIAAIFVVIDILILAYLIYGVISGSYGEDLTSIPAWLVFALDHAIFVGVMSNLIFGLVMLATDTGSRAWAWADDVIFWGMNIGMIGFVVGLAMDSAEIKRVSSPIMGVAILIGLAAMAMRLVEARRAEPAAA
jgi:hypothetical protein